VSPGAGTPTGTVDFLEGATTLASGVTLNGSDQATFTTSSLAVGSHTITANYSGDTSFSASTGDDSASPQVVNQASTTTTLASTPNPSTSGTTVTFTATVAPVSPGAGTPTGTVNFLEGATTLASSVTLNGSDQATFTISSLAVGTHTITANYSGDTDFLASTGDDSSSPQVVT
jgi:large repetitive protein